MDAKNYIQFLNVEKRFGSIVANHNVNFSVQQGTIHAIVGENGAGKSTIMKILFGLYPKDSGQIFIQDQEVHFTSPIEAKSHGIGMVHQHFMLSEPMTALDHFFLEETSFHFLKNFFPLKRKKLLKELNQLSQKFNMPVPWMKLVKNLPVGVQQRIEVLKILYKNANILILDEPTAALTPQEVHVFFEQLRFLKETGKTIILITHKLNEVMAIADFATVMQKGTTVLTKKVSELNESTLASLIVGTEIKAIKKPVLQKTSNQNIVLNVKNLSLIQKNKKILDRISFKIRAGEILGLAGVSGNGQSELIQALLCPQDQHYDGEILYLGKNTLSKKTKDLRKMQMACLPENRLKQALLLDQNAPQNFLMGFQNGYQKNGILNNSQILEKTKKAFQTLDIHPFNFNLELKYFSGGNQQKLVVAREIQTKPKLLIAAQPTRGVDIGAIQTIHQELLKLQSHGTAILLISTELSEILNLSNRIMIMFDGKIKATLENQNLSEEELGRHMGGLS